MSKMRKFSSAHKPILNGETKHARWFVTALITSAAWMVVGCFLALIQGDSVHVFALNWVNYGGPALVFLGTWLLLMIKSGSFASSIAALTGDRPLNLGIIGTRRFRFLIAGVILVLNFGSGVLMGFGGHGLVFVFQLITFFCVVVATAYVVLHAFDIVGSVHGLQHQQIKLSHYSPARTPQLRNVVRYFSTYVLLMTLGEACGLLGSLRGHWTSPQIYIDMFRWFWPFIYFPLCSVMLIYPHLVVHKLIQKEKRVTLSTYQDELEGYLAKPENNSSSSQIERTNNLAQLVDRIAASPNYVFDFGIAARTLLPLVLNVLTLFLKASMVKS